MADVKISNGRGGWLRLKLLEDQNGRPIFSATIPNTTQQSVQLGEATYAARIPGINAVFVQPDLSGGVGKRTQVPSQTGEDFRLYHYADGVDASIPQMVGPGPATATITKLTNMGSLTGSFELGGYCYLVGGREIAKYDHAAGTISEAVDLGAGVSGYGGATIIRTGAEASDVSVTGTGATDTITGPFTILAQKVTPTVSKDLGKVDIQVVRTDVTAVQNVAVGATGGTFTLSYGSGTTSALAWNVSAADMQTALRLLAGLSAVTVTGIATTIYQVTFVGVVGPALLLVGGPASLTGGAMSVTVTAARVGATVIGNVDMAVQMDFNGRPSMEDIAVATVDAAGLPTTAGTVAFRFDDGDQVYQEAGVPYWIVLRVSGATKDATVGWTKNTTGTQNGLISTDLGNAWSATYDHYYVTYSKAITATAYVGKDTAAKFLYTSNGATFTADATHEGKHIVVWGNMLVRDCRASSAGAISWSYDGVNWSEPLVVGDTTEQVTALLPLTGALLVVKESGVWTVDPSVETPDPRPVYMAGGKSTTNGVGSCVWQGVAFVPFDGKLMAISGDASNGFSVKQDIGPDSRAEWDAPFGAGRVVAVAGDRHALYAAMSTSGVYRLFKSYDPENAAWHGSIADLGTSTTFTHMKVFDRGGTNSPLLFYSTTSDDLGKIILPRTRVPWADTSYQVSTTTGSLYHPWASGNAQINMKAWITISETFAQEAAGGYVDEIWDSVDGNGWRALDDGRLYRTGETPMPLGLTSKLLKRQTRLTAGSATAYPLLAASGLTYAVRPPERMRQFAFVVDAQDGQSARDLGNMLGTTGRQVSASAFLAATSNGTMAFEDPDGQEWRLLVINATDTLMERKDGSKRAAVEIVGVSQ